MSTLEAQLSAPWDAAWLAERWPDVFNLVSADRGVVGIHDVGRLIALSCKTNSVGILWRDGVLTLCVFRDCARLVEV